MSGISELKVLIASGSRLNFEDDRNKGKYVIQMHMPKYFRYLKSKMTDKRQGDNRTLTYKSVYYPIVDAIAASFQPEQVQVNFSVIALHKTKPFVHLRFSMLQVKNQKKSQWECILHRETHKDLYQSCMSMLYHRAMGPDAYEEW